MIGFRKIFRSYGAGEAVKKDKKCHVDRILKGKDDRQLRREFQ
jgi:hypothetical protein